MTHQKSFSFLIFLFLTLLSGIVLNAPFHNFQGFLAQGDHGRDLYAAAAVLRGEIPYKDFWWVYGPLMPYYYGAFFKIFGMQISSILLGKIVLNVLSGIFIFLGFSRIFPNIAACLCAIWFMCFHQDFFFTYNHVGGIAVMLAVVWMHWAYIKEGCVKYAWGALFAVFILGLIKINFALVALLMTVLTIALCDYFNKTRIKQHIYISAIILIPLAWFGIYTALLSGLSTAEIRQCLPYLGGDEPYNHLSPFQTIPTLFNVILSGIKSNWFNLGLCALILTCTVYAFGSLLIRKTNIIPRRTIWLILGYCTLFYVLNLHEFFKSGVFYRSFWAQPMSVLLTFVLITYAAMHWINKARILLWIILFGLAGFSFWTTFQNIQTLKTPQHFFGGTRGGVYISNDRSWIQTVVLTTKQLNQTLKPNELFLALPYDCLYYYLTDRKSPTRQLIFFDHIKIPFEQEEKIITQLQQANIKFIVISNRQNARETGLGTLGITYCPMISQYINTNFIPVAKIGDWTNEPGWAWNHGTLIFKKNEQ